MNDAAPAAAHQWRGVIEEYRDRCRSPTGTPVVTLREGGTPLVHVRVAVRADRRRGLAQGRGQQPDRLVQGPRHDGRDLAWPCTRAPRRWSARRPATRRRRWPRTPPTPASRRSCWCPQGKIAAGKMAQALVHGAQVIRCAATSTTACGWPRGLAWHYPVALVNSVNPVRLEGQKTAAFEIVDFLGDAPDYHLLPVGNAGNISAYWLGYTQYAERARPPARPDARASRPRARRRSSPASRSPTRRPSPPRSASATPPRGSSPRRPRDESGGRFAAVTDDADPVRPARARRPRRRLRRAGLGRRRRRPARRARSAASRTRGSTVVITVTGHGLKDTATALEGSGALVDDGDRRRRRPRPPRPPGSAERCATFVEARCGSPFPRPRRTSARASTRSGSPSTCATS